MPHLLLVSHTDPPEPTGIPYATTAMAEWFVAQGWRVTVLTTGPSRSVPPLSHGVHRGRTSR